MVQCPCELCSRQRQHSPRSTDAQLPEPDAAALRQLWVAFSGRPCLWSLILPFLSIERLHRFMQISASFTRLLSGVLKRELEARLKHHCTTMETGVIHCFHLCMRIRFSRCLHCGTQGTWYTRFHILQGQDWETDQVGIRVHKWDLRELQRRLQRLMRGYGALI